MPPCAALEWLRIGCTLVTIATSPPARAASSAARIPARPAPRTRTSWSKITAAVPPMSGHGSLAIWGVLPQNRGHLFRAVDPAVGGGGPILVVREHEARRAHGVGRGRVDAGRRRAVGPQVARRFEQTA